MFINKTPREILRKLLAFLVERTLKKHDPLIIFVKGDKNSSIITEFLYKILLNKYNARKSLERSEIEFSIPLTILGYLYYPSSYFEWVKIIFKSFIQIFTIKPYKHLLIIQIREITPYIYKFWERIINPSIIINAEEFTSDEIGEIQNKNIIPKMEKYLTRLNIDIKEANKQIKEEILDPSLRFDIRKLNENGILIDARYYYHKPSIESILETLILFKGEKFILTNEKLKGDNFKVIDEKYVRKLSLLTNPYVLAVIGRKNEFEDVMESL